MVSSIHHEFISLRKEKKIEVEFGVSIIIKQEEQVKAVLQIHMIEFVVPRPLPREQGHRQT